MGKASRLKAEKRKAPPPVGKRQGPSQRTVLFGTIGLVAVVAIAGRRRCSRAQSSPSKPPPAAASAADKNAPASLVKAADAVGFSPRTEAGVGNDRGQARLRGEPPVEPEPPPGRLDGLPTSR